MASKRIYHITVGNACARRTGRAAPEVPPGCASHHVTSPSMGPVRRVTRPPPMEAISVHTRSLSQAHVFRFPDNELSDLLGDVVRILWFVAGTAMLLFGLFLAVLLVAGVAFRLWPRSQRRRPRLVFGISTALTVLAVTAVTFTGWAPSASRAAERPTAAPGNATAVRYANRTATGAGLRATTARSLILTDYSGVDPKANELWATMLANLLSHFGTWNAHPVATYQTGEMAGYDAVFYLGEQGGGGAAAHLPRRREPQPAPGDLDRRRHRAAPVGCRAGAHPGVRIRLAGHEHRPARTSGLQGHRAADAPDRRYRPVHAHRDQRSEVRDRTGHRLARGRQRCAMGGALREPDLHQREPAAVPEPTGGPQSRPHRSALRRAESRSRESAPGAGPPRGHQPDK